MRKYAAFDIETATVIPDGEDWGEYRPLGITCAAVGNGDEEDTLDICGRDFAPRLSQEEAVQLVETLEEYVDQGYTLLTWNGLGFDFDILAEESGESQRCAALALDHVDMMFHVYSVKGFPVSLAKAAEGMKIRGKPEGINGKAAPQLWAAGEYATVLDYVAEDVRIAHQIATACEAVKEFRWITARGKLATMPLSGGWLTVREAMELPAPDTSWMDDPIPRERFVEWLEVWG